jgi:hypothetical protein
VATRTVYPGILPSGARVSVLAQDGITPIPNVGAVVEDSDYYDGLLAQQKLLDHDPVNSGGPPVSLLLPLVVIQDAPQPGEALVATSPTTAAWSLAPGGGGSTPIEQATLSASSGTSDRQLQPAFVAHDYPGGPSWRPNDVFAEWSWKAGDTSATNAWECVSAAGGRWRRIWSREIDVRWFGARGNGYTGPSGHGDTSAIQAAINAAEQFNAHLVASGGRSGVAVLLQPTTYIVSDEASGRPYKLLMKSYVDLRGSGKGKTVLRSALGQGSNARCLASEAGVLLRSVTIRDLSIDGRETSQPAAGNYQRAGIFLNESADVTITQCEIYNTGDCIRLHGTFCDRAVITHNTCHSCPTDIGREVIQVNACRDSVISWNHIYDCPWATAIKMEGGQGWGNIFEGNVATNVGAGFACHPVADFAVPDSGRRIQIINNKFTNVINSIAISCFGSHLQISGNVIDGCKIAAIALLGQSHHSVVTNNTISNVRTQGPSTPQCIVVESHHEHTERPGSLIIANNIIDIDCALETFAKAIRINQSPGPLVIQGNIITGGAQTGVEVTAAIVECTGVSIVGNYIDVMTSGFGIALGGDEGAFPAQLNELQIIGNTVRPALLPSGSVARTGNTTNMSYTIQSLSDVSGISVGMFVEGAGIQSRTRVHSVTGSSVKIDKMATATGTSVSLTFRSAVNAAATTGVAVFGDVDYLVLVGNSVRRCATPMTDVLTVPNRQVANNFGTVA